MSYRIIDTTEKQQISLNLSLFIHLSDQMGLI